MNKVESKPNNHQYFNQDLIGTAERMGVSKEAKSVLAQITSQKAEFLAQETIQEWPQELRAEIEKFLIRASDELRESMTDTTWEITPDTRGELKAQINLFSFLENICVFLHKITNNGMYERIMYAYQGRKLGLNQRLRHIKKPSLHGTITSKIQRELREAIRARSIPFDEIN
ncbi:hypothetical protein COY05_02720 [Candidatus Peregrinibacteria bacterium CG_4_10_14_0_2_um_filter_38_24]|nr:MAG: hypothetical protein COY05_02720 [Candidatus Peregrinibacteria bacterium CG_4_10_14_0_2_um_filter_38_24]